jgi:hypothetical protein
MKKIRIFTIVLFISVLGISSCNQDEILSEIPKDFLSPENSFTNKEQFESALADVYKDIRTTYYTSSAGGSWYNHIGVDVDLFGVYLGTAAIQTFFNWNTLNADNGFVSTWWSRYYQMIFKANTVIGRAELDVAQWASEEEKNAIVAEAKFLRAFNYSFLANMWGGVPIVLEETAEAKFDYTRASQTEVYNQCVEDLLFSVKHMNTIDKQKGGRAPRAAAYHLLTQIYIQLGKYQEAINAATQVIDDPNYHLMTERFGKWTNFTFNGYDYQGEYEIWGDVYWDMFREDNFNRIDGNMECIWNIQMDIEIPGGGKDTQWGGDFLLGYAAGGPFMSRVQDKNGVQNPIKDTLQGRPVGWFLATDYLANQIWEYKDDWNKDIRNSKYNIQRDYYYTNPASAFYGQLVTTDNIKNPSEFKACTAPSFKKLITTVHYGLAITPEGQRYDNGRIFKDWYLMRLAETYLLRAEAYHLNGDNAKAAADINAIRNRAKATPIDAGDVNLDLILDERARELTCEEFRLNTLMRMDKLSEYLEKYNDYVVANGQQLGDHLNKFPIPNSEIEANKEVVLEQNPGY